MMARLAQRFLGPVVLLVLVCASVGTVAAQGTATAVPTQGNSQFTGKVSKVSPFTVNSNGQDRVVNPGPNVAVTRDGKTAQLADLKVGDQVNVTANPDGTAARVETTRDNSGLPGWLIPLLLVLVLIGLIAYFLSRRKDSFVLEKDQTNTQRPNTPPRR